MIQLKPGDIVSFIHDQTYYYAVILSKKILFGGHLVFAFHFTTRTPTLSGEVLKNKSGFNAIVDFIWAKRENRIAKLGVTTDLEKYRKFLYFKQTHSLKGKAQLWFISDENLKEIKRITHLSREEKAYPLASCVDDYMLKKMIDERLLPEKDPRI